MNRLMLYLELKNNCMLQGNKVLLFYLRNAQEGHAANESISEGVSIKEMVSIFKYPHLIFSDIQY